MGRRKKAAKKAVKKKRPTVAKVFKCILCNHDKSVTCRVNYDNRVGELNCSICAASYRTAAHELTEPIDIFTDWLDATNEEQMKAVSKYALRQQPASGVVERLREEERENAEEEDPNHDVGSLEEFDEDDQ